MKWPRFLEGSTSQPRRLLDEDGQSPAAALLRAARRNGPPPPAGAKERAMAALGRASADTSETVHERPPGAEVPPPRAEVDEATKRPPGTPDGAKVFEWVQRPARWPRIVQGVAIAAAAILPLWMWLRRPADDGVALAPVAPYPSAMAPPTGSAVRPPAAFLQRPDAEPLVIRQPEIPQSGVEPIVVVRLSCGDARRLVRPVDIVYPRDAVAAGVEADMLVSCNVSQEGAFERCRDAGAPANAKIDAAEVLRSVGTWRYAIPSSEQALLSSTCTVRIQFQLQPGDSTGR